MNMKVSKLLLSFRKALNHLYYNNLECVIEFFSFWGYIGWVLYEDRKNSFMSLVNGVH